VVGVWWAGEASPPHPRIMSNSVTPNLFKFYCNYSACHSLEKTRDYVNEVTLALERSAGDNLLHWNVETLHYHSG